EGEEILELETEKVNQVVYAPASGQLDLKVKVNDVVKIGQVVGTIDTDKAGTLKAEGKSQKAEVRKEPEKGALRVKEEEYLNEIKQKKEEPAPAKTEVKKQKAEVGKQRRERLSGLRKLIGQRLLQAKNETAMLTTFNEVDLSKVIDIRKKEQENFQKKHGTKLGFMSFFVKASVLALQAFPDVNAFIDGDEIVYCDYYDIGIAVSTDKGLMVPVIKGCDILSFAEIESQLQQFADQARKGVISVDVLKGGTFTISNAGIYGSLLSTPILNPPQSAILGMHAIQERPVAINGKVEIRPMMYLALSYDHRIIDGKEAVSFLMHIKKNLEEPSRFLLDL
ncbi:MAG TPA: dihydrolipoyllysine-residue succinyltransferase, partial [Chlamydiales bacterium]|nr:dihydrolipoyllysine-residue succinyltransferase [Chlamydiales bacterium]